MGHHCPTCKKTCSTVCIGKGHVKRCSKHDILYMPGKTCASCAQDAELAANRERQRKEESR
ncbi:hypothetical protein C8A05DRAFT_39774, partial [Staphylotrichum tortipilum]